VSLEFGKALQNPEEYKPYSERKFSSYLNLKRRIPHPKKFLKKVAWYVIPACRESFLKKDVGNPHGRTRI
jgi:hypothetical protein